MIQVKGYSAVDIVAIFEHDRGQQHEADVEEVHLVGVAVVEVYQAVLVDEPYLFRGLIGSGVPM